MFTAAPGAARRLFRGRGSRRNFRDPTFHTRRNKSNWFPLSLFFPSPYQDAESFFLSLFFALLVRKAWDFSVRFVRSHVAIATVDAIHRVTGVIFPSRDFPRSARNNVHPSSVAFISENCGKKKERSGLTVNLLIRVISNSVRVDESRNCQVSSIFLY